MKSYMTIQELIDELKKFPGQATVGIRSFCCNHAHDISRIHSQEESDWADESEVTIETEN